MLYTLKEIAELFQVQPQTIIRLANAGEFPKPMRLSRRLFRWRKVDIDAHIIFLAGAEKTEQQQAN